MRRTSHVFVLATLILSLAVPALASTIAPPPSLGALARVSKAVVFAEAQRSWNEVHGAEPYTVTAFRVLQEIKGPVPGSLEVQVDGGIAGTVGVTVTGAPKFEKGARYVLFLDPARSGRWTPKMLSYGLLREDTETGTLRPLPEAADLQVIARPGVEPVGTYRERELLQMLGSVAAGATPWYRDAAEIKPLDLSLKSTAAAGAALTNAPQNCAFVPSPDGYPMRWTTFETGGTLEVWHTTPGQTGISDGGLAAVQNGIAAWSSQPNAVVNLHYAGSKTADVNCAANGTAYAPNNEVIFNDPCSDIADLAQTCSDGSPTPAGWTSPCCGTVAEYRTYSDMSQFNQHDGNTWRPIQAMSIVVNNGAQCVGETDFQEVMTHFLGHAVGFGHHNDQNATMYAQLGVHPSRGAALGQTDIICAEYDYHTFLDVPYNYWAWPYIEAIQNARITLGCGGGNYCLTNQASRAEMAVFLIRATHGADYVPPPATGTVFNDVPADYWAAPQIEQLYRDGLTKGCQVSPPLYCPSGNVSRAEMATFLVRVKHGVDYTPPPAQGTFTDVPTTYWAAPQIEQVYNDGITNGCSASPLKYCPEDKVVRDQMAAFLARVLNLPLPQ